MMSMISNQAAREQSYARWVGSMSDAELLAHLRTSQPFDPAVNRAAVLLAELRRRGLEQP